MLAIAEFKRLRTSLGRLLRDATGNSPCRESPPLAWLRRWHEKTVLSTRQGRREELDTTGRATSTELSPFASASTDGRYQFETPRHQEGEYLE